MPDVFHTFRVQKVIKMKSVQLIQKSVYEMLDLLETERPQHIRLFWKCVFEEHLLLRYPTLRQLRNSLMDGQLVPKCCYIIMSSSNVVSFTRHFQRQPIEINVFSNVPWDWEILDYKGVVLLLYYIIQLIILTNNLLMQGPLQNNCLRK